jgi:hypothetical protein
MKITRRLENKYFISYLDYFKIITAVQNILIHDKHGTDDSYDVISIYIDDIVFSGAADKAFGNEVHKKYRIRHYNDPNILKLELKYKIGDLSTKHSTSINQEVCDAIINQDLDVLERYFDDDLIRRYTLDMMKNHLEAKCYIKYKREAYKDELDNIRLTFDHSLSAERFSVPMEGMDMNLMHGNNLILEVKYENYMPSTVKEILKRITLNQIAYSKYFLGFNSLEL